ncbi:MAG: hypothetical protein KAY24_13735 [Candidatus Eisenbacteria sp.]|nr:hypothetical protein [Candidatus Eisenbacteria bacterium]
MNKLPTNAIILTALCLCFTSLASATPPPRVKLPPRVTDHGPAFHFDNATRESAEIHYIDLTGDQIREAVVQMRGVNAGGEGDYSFTMVFELNDGEYERTWTNISGERPNGLEFHDIDGDSVHELILHETAGAHYSVICIVSYAAGQYVKLFENGTACHLLEFEVSGPAATITIGRENWSNAEFCYANSHELSHKEIWRWSNGAFAYDAAASSGPFMTEKEAIQRAVDSITKTMLEIRAVLGRAQADQDPGVDRADMRVLYLWTAGIRAYMLFGPEVWGD